MHERLSHDSVATSEHSLGAQRQTYSERQVVHKGVKALSIASSLRPSSVKSVSRSVPCHASTNREEMRCSGCAIRLPPARSVPKCSLSGRARSLMSQTVPCLLKSCVSEQRRSSVRGPWTPTMHRNCNSMQTQSCSTVGALAWRARLRSRPELGWWTVGRLGRERPSRAFSTLRRYVTAICVRVRLRVRMSSRKIGRQSKIKGRDANRCAVSNAPR